MSILRGSLVLTSLFLVHCHFTDLRAIYFNNQTSKTIKNKSIDESQVGYLKALDIEPLLPAVHSNLGATYDTLKDPERALKLYKNAEDYSRADISGSENQTLISRWEKNSLYMTLFAALYNQGQLLGRENKIDEALEKYQAALDLNPNSQEIKTNIELMFQQQQSKGQGGEGDSDKNQDKNQEQQSQNQDKDKKGDDSDKDKENGEKPKNYSASAKYRPRDFKGDLTKENVQKIFGEISQQEKKMRSQFSKQNQTKEAPREKDW